MIYVLIDKDKRITGAVDTRRIIGFVFDGTSPEYDPRYTLKLDYGHDLQIGSLDMKNILGAMMREGEKDETD